MNPSLCVSLLRANLLATHPNIQFDNAIKFDNTTLWIEVINNNTLSLAFEHEYAQIYTNLSIEEFLIELGKRKKSSPLWIAIVESGIILQSEILLEIGKYHDDQMVWNTILRTKIVTDPDELVQIPYFSACREIFKIGLVEDIDFLVKIGKTHDCFDIWSDFFALGLITDFQKLLDLGIELNSKFYWEALIKSGLVKDLVDFYNLVSSIIEIYQGHDPDYCELVWIYAVESGMIRDLTYLQNLAKNIPTVRMQVAVIRTGAFFDQHSLMDFGREVSNQEAWIAILEMGTITDPDLILGIALHTQSTELRVALAKYKEIDILKRYHWLSVWQDVEAFKAFVSTGEITDLELLSSIGQAMDDEDLWYSILFIVQEQNQT
jgi:hypothetical protein